MKRLFFPLFLLFLACDKEPEPQCYLCELRSITSSGEVISEETMTFRRCNLDILGVVDFERSNTYTWDEWEKTPAGTPRRIKHEITCKCEFEP
jgi:hypothetical protein